MKTLDLEEFLKPGADLCGQIGCFLEFHQP